MKNSFAKFLTNYRVQNGLSQKQFAKILGWTPMYYGRFENSYLLPKSDITIQKFAKATKANPEEVKTLVEISKKEFSMREND